MPAGRPVFDRKADLTFINHTMVDGNVKRYHFQMNGKINYVDRAQLQDIFAGPDHMAIFLSPSHESEVINWSFADEIVPNGFGWDNRITYFIFFAYAIDNSAYDFFVDIRTDDDFTVPSLDIAITGQYLHHDQLQTDEFRNFVSSFPTWAHVTPWMSSYEGFQY